MEKGRNHLHAAELVFLGGACAHCSGLLSPAQSLALVRQTRWEGACAH